MKIGMVVPSWPPGSDANGIVTYAANVIPALKALGHEVFVLTYNPLTEDSHTIDLRKFSTRSSIFDRFRSSGHNALAAAVKQLVTEKKIDILEVEETFGSSAAVSRLNILPVVVRLHGPWFLNKQWEEHARETREGTAIRSATFVTAPSRSVLNATIARYGLSDLHCSVVYNPIKSPIKTWKLENCDRDSILFVGRFDKIKGGDLAVRAFGQLALKNSRLKLTFVGPDNGVDGVKFDQYTRRELSPTVLDRVKFLGYQKSIEIEDLRLRHFITFSASRYEVFGYTVLEAMASGCPVVAPDVGGISELITTGSDGLLFEAGCAGSLASACQKMFDNPSVAIKIGIGATHATKVRFDPEQTAVFSTEFYRQACEAFDLSNRNRF